MTEIKPEESISDLIEWKKIEVGDLLFKAGETVKALREISASRKTPTLLRGGGDYYDHQEIYGKETKETEGTWQYLFITPGKFCELTIRGFINPKDANLQVPNREEVNLDLVRRFISGKRKGFTEASSISCLKY